MPVRFRSLRVEGFRSFTDRQIFRFPKGNGLHLLRGENRAEPRLGANGSGKSSLWDALCWCLYGKTARGLKGPDVGNWRGNDMTDVTARFKRLGVHYELDRTWRPASLTLKVNAGRRRHVTQAEVDSLVGFDYHAFLAACLMGQFNRFFLDLSPAEKLNAFAAALGLDAWDRAARNAARRAAGLDDEVSGLRDKRSALIGKIIEIKSERKRAIRDARAYQRTRDDEVRRAEEHAGELRRELQKHAKETRIKEAELTSAEKASDAVIKRNKEREKQTRRAEDELRRINDQLNDAVKRRKEQESFASGKCPTCGRPTPKKDAKNRIDAISQEIAVLIAKREVTSDELRHLDDERGVGELEAKDAGDREHDARPAFRRAEDALRETRSKLESVRNRLRELKTGENPHERRLAEVKQSLKSARHEFRANRTLFRKAKVEREFTKRWATLFKELRLWLIRDALAQLDVETANALPKLGLDGWTISNAVERTNQRGKVTSGFSTFVKSPSSLKPVRWEAWCGGETQRLRIAGAAGFAALIRQRAGQEAPKLEAWDEPTAHLSEQGVNDALSFFADRGARTQVWLIDHRSLKAGEFASESCIIKGTAGSRVVQERA